MGIYLTKADNAGDIQVHILAEDGTWAILNRLLTENRKLDQYSGDKREQKRAELIKRAENMRDRWLGIVFPNRIIKVTS